jgi:hypothetical protein
LLYRLVTEEDDQGALAAAGAGRREHDRKS